jgi:hypothetical protein
MVRLAKILVVISSVAFAVSLRAAERPSPDFKHDVLPLLKNRCVRCHGPAENKAELNLALPSGIVRGGEKGKVVVVGKPDESSLWLRVAADEMPEDEPLPPEEKEVLRRWIAEGAHGLPENVSAKPDGDEHWAFQNLDSPRVPEVRDASRVRTPIDQFILKELEAN